MDQKLDPRSIHSDDIPTENHFTLTLYADGVVGQGAAPSTTPSAQQPAATDNSKE